MQSTILKIKIFLYNEFNKIKFINFIMENLSLNKTYTILIKFGFKNNSMFYMSGSQIGIKIVESHNISYYENVYDIIILRLEDLISKYEIENMPDTIEIYYKTLNIPKNLILNKKELDINSLNKSIFRKNKIKQIVSSKYLPLTLNRSDFGYLVEGSLKQNYIKRLISNISKNGIKLPSYLLNFNIINLSNVYIKNINIRDSKLECIILDLPINLIYEKDNIKHSNIEKNKNLRLIFDINSGICLSEILDLFIKKDIFIRKSNGLNLLVYKNKLTEISREIRLESIKPSAISNKGTFMSNPNIGVLDVETFINSKNLSQVYCMGFGTLNNIQSEQINTFYLTDIGPSLNSNFLIINCINSMLVPKYNNYYWYIHNMGKFDIIFIYKALEEFNLIYNEEFYKLNTTYKDGKMLKLVIKRKFKTKEIKITFLDSFNILSQSLDTLTKDFNVKHLKSVFPYSFVNENNLNYIGETPSIKYYKELKPEIYQELYFKKYWSLRAETLKYLKSDILGLLEVLDKFKSTLFIEHNLEMTEGLTISRLALNKYLNFYLKDHKLPLINKLNIFNFMYLGYYGGRTEVFKPYGKNLFYYDVNSLYPFVALNKLPGLNCSYKKSFSDKGLNLNSLFGIFKARVKTNNNNLGLLPIKTNLGLIFPNGEYEGIWPTPELKYAKEQGYQIKVIEGYNFNKVDSYFEEYVRDLYSLKSKTTGSKKSVNKSLLNNLLGRFGLNIIKPVTKVVDKNKFDLLLSSRKVISYKEITSNAILINYNPIIDINTCLEHGVDAMKLLLDQNNFNIEKKIDIFQDVSILISALITSYARVYMLNILKLILESDKGSNIYYMDTDSIITDTPLPLNLIGDKLGQFKLVYEIKEAYFISNKTYCLILKNGNVIIKSKGTRNDSLNLNDFKQMYLENKNIFAYKQSTTTNLSQGSVVIEDKRILLKPDVYTKRNKIFNQEGLWINTKPLFYNNLEKRIVSYKKK